MHDNRSTFRRRAGQLGLAALAATALVTGAAWRESANAQAAAVQTVTTPITRSIAGGRDSYADVVKVVAPAVVTVHATGKARLSPTEFQMPDDDLFRRFFGDRFDRAPQQRRAPRTFRQNALGSGVIVSADGDILTNNHVIDSADDIKVDLTDGRSFGARLVGTDKASDLALLKVSATDLHALALGNSDAVQVGDVVLAVGNPLNLGQTVTMGIISAKGRSTARGDGSYEDFLQTDAPINHGNSGGALVNTKGELVGINSQILSPSDGNIGIGFAIPANMARHVMDELRASGKVTRGQLGVTVQEVNADIAANLGLKQTGGAIVSSVSAGSAAEHAGIRQNDVIVSFNGQPVHDTNSLRNRVADAKPGSTATVVIVRDGSEKTVSVRLDEAKPARSARAGRDDDDGPAASSDKTALGVTVSPITPETARQLGVPSDAKGLVVEDVNPDGRAADAGIQPGDVIEQVNRQAVQSVEDLKGALKRSADRPTLLLINRQGSTAFVTVKPANG